MSIKILTSSSLAQRNQLSTIFVSSTESSNTTTAPFNQSATTIKQTHTHSSLTVFSTSVSTLIATTTPTFSFITKSLSHSMMSVTYSLMLTKSLISQSMLVTYSPYLTHFHCISQKSQEKICSSSVRLAEFRSISYNRQMC